jgi:hypothetical protein
MWRGGCRPDISVAAPFVWVRDKIAASKRKGIWVGGPVPLGYRCIRKKLVVVPEEAETVRTIFRRPYMNAKLRYFGPLREVASGTSSFTLCRQSCRVPSPIPLHLLSSCQLCAFSNLKCQTIKTI